ncbi:MAG: hypothetical protein K2M46_07060 [Lachnospiraceae bacterium]|nr:hypothetical protein [Lachnospiraceae bacterium]
MQFTKRNEKVRVEAVLENQTVVYFMSELGTESVIFKGYRFYTCGFSYDGEYFVFAQDAGIMILSRV